MTPEWFEKYRSYWENHLYVSLREWHDEIMDTIREDGAKVPGDVKNLGGGLHAFESGLLGGYIDSRRATKYLGFPTSGSLGMNVRGRLPMGYTST